MPDVRITLLGGFGVAVDGRLVPAAHWRRRQAAALVKILALAPGRTWHGERVIDALWPEVTVTVGGESWRLFDLLTLQGLLAHHRGEWFQRLRGELRSVMRRPALAVGIFDSHLCVAEYLLYGPTPYDEVMELARELRETAARSGVPRAVAFATALRGEAALLKGDLALAETELRAAADLHHDLESPAGEAHCLERLAEVVLAHGNRGAAARLLQRALPLARWSIIGQHLCSASGAP